MAYRIMEPRFPLGRTVATPAAMALGIDLASYMHRHHCGDWGDLDEGDKQTELSKPPRFCRICEQVQFPEISE